MIGQRIFADKYGHLRLPEWGYGRDMRGRWWVRAEGEDSQQIPSASVTEHADGTITVREGINGSAKVMIQHGVWEVP